MRRGRFRWAVGMGWGITGLLGVVLVLRLVAHDAALPLIVANMFTPYVYLPAWVVLAVALAARRRGLVVASAILCAAHLAWIVAGVVPRAPVRSAPGGIEAGRRFRSMRVMTANLLMVNTDTAGIVGEIMAARPDVLLVQEMSAHWAAALSDQRVTALLPHRIGIAREDSFGTAILSRLPLEDGEVIDVEGLPMSRATVRVAGRAVRVYNVHTLPPRTAEYTETWNRQMAALVRLLERETGPVVAGGDFNATQHAYWYGRLMSGRLRSAHEDLGRGLATTWPNGVFSLPSVRLDHVLLSPEIACRNVREGEGRGSDHRPIVLDAVLL